MADCLLTTRGEKGDPGPKGDPGAATDDVISSRLGLRFIRTVEVDESVGLSSSSSSTTRQLVLSINLKDNSDNTTYYPFILAKLWFRAKSKVTGSLGIGPTYMSGAYESWVSMPFALVTFANTSGAASRSYYGAIFPGSVPYLTPSAIYAAGHHSSTTVEVSGSYSLYNLS